MMFIDTHTHLFVEQFNEDREEVVQRATDAGVEVMLLPNIDLESIPQMNELAAKYPQQRHTIPQTKTRLLVLFPL